MLNEIVDQQLFLAVQDKLVECQRGAHQADYRDQDCAGETDQEKGDCELEGD